MPAPWWQVYAFGLVLLPFPQVGVLVKRRDADELNWLSVLGNIRVYHRDSLTGGKNQTEVPEGWCWSLRLIGNSHLTTVVPLLRGFAFHGFSYSWSTSVHKH